MTVHVVIPDTQAKSGAPTEHLGWIGQYVVDQFAGKPDVKIIHLGDHADMPSLSSYDRGKKAMEGRRYQADIKAANNAFDILCEPLDRYNRKRAGFKEKQWWPERHILLGNHEDRITRAAEDNAQIDGLVSLDHLNYAAHGWQVHSFLQPVILDGIAYAHYFYQPLTGRAYTGTIDNRLRQIGHSFTMGHQQTLLYGVRYVLDRTQHGLIAGACLTPDHRVLTADLRYVPLGDIVAGDQLVSFDETLAESPGRSRRYKTGTVRAVRSDVAQVYGVTLSDGKTFKVTGDHLWLSKTGTKYHWRPTSSLRLGSRLVKSLDEWGPANGFDAGYLAGMYDGEGCYYTRRTSSGYAAQLTVSQLPGPVLDRTTEILGDLCGSDALTHTNSRGVASLRLRGGTRAIAKILGQVRPVRLLPKFKPEHLGRVSTVDSENPTVVHIEPLGEREIVRIDVDAGTMIVEGYAHHNCYLHEEDYKGPQGNAHWRGIVVCHEVVDGRYDPMMISLDYLCRRYEGKSLDKFLSRRQGVAA